VEVQNNAAGMDKEKSPQRPILSLQAFLNSPVGYYNYLFSPPLSIPGL
jgi:hypothetical protein